MIKKELCNVPNSLETNNHVLTNLIIIIDTGFIAISLTMQRNKISL